MRKKIFGVLLVLALVILLGNRQSADAATNDYEMVPTATSGRVALLNTQGNPCVNSIHGYNDQYENKKIYSDNCNHCGAWIYTCFIHKLELPEEDYNDYTEDIAVLAHGAYSEDCKGWNSGYYTNSTRIYYKTEVYEVSNSERVTLSD